MRCRKGCSIICGIDKKQLTVREFVKSREIMRELFCEVHMVIMPSKSEGFGLVAVEALSAGLPILVGSNSGFARAIEDIPLGLFNIVDSEDPSKWAERMEGVRDRHRVALQENEMLKDHYGKKYCWKTQREELVDRLWKMVYGKVFIKASTVKILCSWQKRDVDSLVDSQIPLYNKYEFAHLDHFSFMTIDIDCEWRV